MLCRAIKEEVTERSFESLLCRMVARPSIWDTSSSSNLKLIFSYIFFRHRRHYISKRFTFTDGTQALNSPELPLVQIPQVKRAKGSFSKGPARGLCVFMNRRLKKA